MATLDRECISATQEKKKKTRSSPFKKFYFTFKHVQ